MQRDALRTEALDLEELEGRRAGTSASSRSRRSQEPRVDDLLEHHRQAFADAGNVGDLALGVA